MFYILDVEDHVRVEPRHFGLPTNEAIEAQLKENFIGSVTKEFGYAIAVLEINNIDEGVIIPGDGAAYYNTRFKILVWKPELHELVYGTISEITNFGAFMQVGPARGMIHISQTMEDYVSLSKSGTLSGKTTKRSLSKDNDCLARIVAISYKAGVPKIGLTMRQAGLGELKWLEEEKKKKTLLQKNSKSEGKKKKKEDK